MERMTMLRAERPPGKPSAPVISFDEMWSYVGARRREKRREAWIWTAVVEEADGGRWACFEVGERSEETFSRLLKRLPEALRCHSDAYERCLRGVRSSAPQPACAGQRRGGEPERGDPLPLRDRVRRLQRKTKGYSKSVEMLWDSIALVYLKLGLI